jgi:predicted DNA-binding WGR domain protein
MRMREKIGGQSIKHTNQSKRANKRTKSTHPFNALAVKCLISAKRAARVEEGKTCALVNWNRINTAGMMQTAVFVSCPQRRTAEYSTKNPTRTRAPNQGKNATQEKKYGVKYVGHTRLNPNRLLAFLTTSHGRRSLTG